jgi:hypothetical protein
VQVENKAFNDELYDEIPDSSCAPVEYLPGSAGENKYEMPENWRTSTEDGSKYEIPPQGHSTAEENVYEKIYENDKE